MNAIATRPEPPRRQLKDARELRALAHPVRMALLELLSVEGPLTATECGERLGQTPANCSFHLRQLAKHGFIEEAAGGTGRQRPWRFTTLGHEWADTPDRPASERAAARSVVALLRQRHAQYLADWLARHDREPAEWRDAAIFAQNSGWLTIAELAEIRDGTQALWDRYRDRLLDPSKRPADSRLVQSFAEAFPVAGVLRPDAAAYDLDADLAAAAEAEPTEAELEAATEAEAAAQDREES
ncbi:MAG TPA: helix-turn-helix domain-containing protein [Actinomycetes bacterium]|nr:helix-turn-helix domain-containing protein [Actinomycetes bacterium]